VRSLSLKGDKNMEIDNRAVKTDRAFILFENIQHISWTKDREMYEVKIYSNASAIIQSMTGNELTNLLGHYTTWNKEGDKGGN
tara:strand:- start:856 stop:1104 length:249 start_codon:yes stop_codon:yes gene_type:complete